MIILASQSPYRKKLLKDFGLRFQTEKPRIDEQLLKNVWEDQNGRPQTFDDFVEMTSFLALKKAESVALLFALKKNVTRSKPAFIIGSDQMAVVKRGNRFIKLDKPGSYVRAEKSLWSLRGTTHHLVTAVSVVKVSSGASTQQEFTLESQTARVIANIKMRKFDRREMLETLKLDHPIDCAGAYKMEKSGLRLVEAIEVSDFTSIVGLPLIATARLLRQAGAL